MRTFNFPIVETPISGLPGVNGACKTQCMTSGLTVRLSPEQREGLRKRAKLLRTNESSLVRSLIDRELQEATIAEKLGPLLGRVDSSAQGKRARHPLAGKLRERNWRR